MARTGLHRADAGSRKSFDLPSSCLRRQRAQRVAAVSWIALVIVIAALSTFAHHRLSAGPAEPTGNSAQPAPGPSRSPAPATLPAWLTESGTFITDVIAARNHLAAAAAEQDIAATGEACRSAAGAVGKLRGQLPSPDPALNSTLQQAVNSYERGLPDCVAATATRDSGGMQRATAFITQGDAAIRRALSILGRQFDVAPPAPGPLIV